MQEGWYVIVQNTPQEERKVQSKLMKTVKKYIIRISIIAKHILKSIVKRKQEVNGDHIDGLIINE